MGRKHHFIFPKISLLKSDKGFTLIELIVVIAVLATLLVMVIIVLNPKVQFNKARDSRRKSDLNNIAKALVMYKNDFSVYPPDDGNGNISACSPSITLVWGTDAFKCSEMTYMKFLPQDPKEGEATYKYKRMGTSGYDFCLWATLENTADLDSARYLSRCLQCTEAVAGDIVVCSD